MVGRPSRRARSGREALLVGREWSGGPPKGLGVVGSYTGKVGKWPGGPLGGPVVVKKDYQRVSRLSWRAKSGREALPEGREWLGGPPGGPGVVGMPS